MNERACNCCGEVKPMTEFYRSNREKSGHLGECKGCRRVKEDTYRKTQGAFRPAELHGHHHDYSKPLEVEWLCRACHEAAHHRVDAIPWAEAA